MRSRLGILAENANPAFEPSALGSALTHSQVSSKNEGLMITANRTVARSTFAALMLSLTALASVVPSSAQNQSQISPQISPMTPDIPEKFVEPKTGYDYIKRVEMVPMRDGVKLYTVIVIPKGAQHAPILLTRTPYNAAGRAARNESPHMLDELPQSDEVFVQAGYIRVYQDVRGKYGSRRVCDDSPAHWASQPERPQRYHRRL